MVRSYKNTKAVPYSNEDLDAAVALLRNDKSMSFRPAACYFGIPTKTLHDHYKEIRLQVGAGKPTILSRDEKREMALTCMVLQDLGFGLTKDVVFLVVRHIFLTTEYQTHSRMESLVSLGGTHL